MSMIPNKTGEVGNGIIISLLSPKAFPGAN